jgi:hypothetical protein
MKTLSTNKCFSVIFFIWSGFNLFAQSNSYFDGNENWSGTNWGAEFFSTYYTLQEGDTIVGGDTLIKIRMPNSSYGPTIDTAFILAKNDSGILHMIYSDLDYSTSGDTIILDFSRTDSVTFLRTHFGSLSPDYEAREISTIDTVTLGNKQKKYFHIYDLCGQDDNDFVLEGAFDLHFRPFFDGCFEYWNEMMCYSVEDSIYTIDWSGSFSATSFSGVCTVSNLSTNNDLNEKIKIYPIPATDELIIDMDSWQDRSSGYISNINGEILSYFVLTNSINYIDVSGYSQGMYFLNIVGSPLRKKIVIQ